jgi:hypothetical protein
MTWIWLIVAAVVPLVTSGCGGSVERTTSTKSSDVVRAITRLREARVFFAHQSVGGNIIDGVAAIQNDSTEPHLNVIDIGAVTGMSGGFLAHARLGKNGDPKGKTDAFVTALEGGLGSQADIALQKYCFVDFDAHTDATEIFAYYKQGVDRVRSKFPNLKVAHVTVPLMAVQGGPKAAIKKLLGRAPDYYAENIVRERFNDLIRQTYKGREPIFDLAFLEASKPGQPREALSFGDSTVYALLPEYTTDGGHLNSAAQRRIATEFLSFLAETVDRGHADGARGSSAF